MRRRHREPEQQRDGAADDEEVEEDRDATGGRGGRLSQSTPGRIAAANVSASSKRMRTLRTCQIPTASATTASAAAVALATRRVKSLGMLSAARAAGRPAVLCGADAPRVEEEPA